MLLDVQDEQLLLQSKISGEESFNDRDQGASLNFCDKRKIRYPLYPTFFSIPSISLMQMYIDLFFMATPLNLCYIYSNRTFIKSINIHGDRHTFLSALNNYTQSSDTITYYLNPQRDYSNILQNYHAVVGLKLAIAIRTETRGHIGNISC